MLKARRTSARAACTTFNRRRRARPTNRVRARVSPKQKRWPRAAGAGPPATCSRGDHTAPRPDRLGRTKPVCGRNSSPRRSHPRAGCRTPRHRGRCSRWDSSRRIRPGRVRHIHDSCSYHVSSLDPAASYHPARTEARPGNIPTASFILSVEVKNITLYALLTWLLLRQITHTSRHAAPRAAQQKLGGHMQNGFKTALGLVSLLAMITAGCAQHPARVAAPAAPPAAEPAQSPGGSEAAEAATPAGVAVASGMEAAVSPTAASI